MRRGRIKQRGRIAKQEITGAGARLCDAPTNIQHPHLAVRIQTGEFRR
jgi:hypothetical protein